MVTRLDAIRERANDEDARADIPMLLRIAVAARQVMVHVEHEECDAAWCVELRAALAPLLEPEP